MGDGGVIIPGIPPPPGGDQGLPGGPPITSETFDIAPGSVQSDFARAHFDLYLRDVYNILNKTYHLPAWISGLVSASIAVPVAFALMFKDLALAILKVFLPPFALVALSVIDDLRKTLDKEFAQLAVSVLGELLGADLDPTQIPVSGDFKGHIARAKVLGQIFHSLLVAEFQTSTPLQPQDGVNNAEVFTGLSINFGTATGIIAALGGLFPEVHLDEMREIGELVAKNLGLGRLTRLAIQPLIKTLVQEPYAWAFNLKYRPTQLTLGDVVNPYAQTIMPADLVHQSLAQLGYSDDKIAALLRLHAKTVTASDVWDLKNRGILSADQATELYKRIGWLEPDIPTFEEVELLKSEASYEKDALNAAGDAYRFGNITRDELATMAKSLLHRDDLAALFMMAQDYKRKVPHRSLTVAQLESAFADGYIDLDEFDSRLATMGYSDEDVGILRYLTLLKLQKSEAAAAAKASKASKSTKSTGGTVPPSTPPPIIPNPPLQT